MILFKKGVKYDSLNPILWDYLLRVHALYAGDIIVTSLNDGTHGDGSRHFKGMAADLRVKHLNKDEQQYLLGLCKQEADKNKVVSMIQVVDEIESKVHIHIEMDKYQGQVT